MTHFDDGRATHTIHDENVDLLIAVLERIALALEGKNAPVIVNLPRDFTVGEVRAVMAEWSKEAAGR